MQAQIRLGRIFGRFHISSSPLQPLRSKSQDIYFNYSLAGPTFISKTTIDTNEIGKQFTFQDFMGVRTSADFQH